MSEWWLFALVLVRLALLAWFVGWYTYGGRRHSWTRGYLGGLGFGLGLAVLAAAEGRWHWGALLLPAAYPAALSLGYGASSFWMKLMRRSVYGLALGACGLWAGWIGGHVVLGAAQMVLAVAASAYLGLRNPLPAVYEEAIIATASVVLVPFLL